MGIILSKFAGPNSPLLQSVFPRPSTFVPDRDILDLTGNVCLITGGNTGIGYETAKQLLLKNATVWIGCRSLEKGANAVERLEKETRKKVRLLEIDLADLRNVRRAANEFLEKENVLGVLFCNAGVMLPPIQELTAQGFDSQFGVNALGHYFLTSLLMPALTAYHAATSTPSRVVHTSSVGHYFVPRSGIEYGSLKGGEERNKWIKRWSFLANETLYGQSKLANLWVSNHFAKENHGTVVSVAVNPGTIDSDLFRTIPGWRMPFFKALQYPVSFGALAQLWAGVVAPPGEINGKYVMPGAVLGKTSKQATSVEGEETLINWMRDQIKEF